MEQVKAEPVAWLYEHPEGHINVTAREDVRSSYEGWTETPLYATPQPAAVDGLVALLKRAEIFANTARSFDWNEDRCAMTAIHLAGDIRQALAQIERTEDGNG
jgi:hypothetical protein